MTSVEELNEIIDVCKKFSAKEIRRSALEADLKSDISWVKSLWARSREIGLPGLIIPEESGGVGQSALCGALLVDVLASECAGLASVFAYHFAGCMPLAIASPAQKEKLLVPLANADIEAPAIATVIFPPMLESSSLRLEEKKGRLRLSGTSPIVGNIELATHILLFLEEDQKEESVTCLIVEKSAGGIVSGEPACLQGLKVNPFGTVVFEDLEISREAILGERGGSGNILENTQNLFYTYIAAAAIGTARAAYLKAHAYAQERYQYGKIIIHHQEIQRMLGAMLLKLSIGTAAYRRFFSQEDLRLPDAFPDARLAKAYCTDAALEIAIDAVQVHGGYGYMHEYGVEKIMRDCKVLQLIGGSNPTLLIQAVARGI